MRTWPAVVAAAQGMACGRIGFDPLTTGDASAALDTMNEPPGLIAHWKLDENMGTVARDSKGGTDGVLSAGSSAIPTWTAGQLNGGLVFAGDGDLVNMGTPPIVANLPTLTISAWVKPGSISIGLAAHVIVDKGVPDAGWAFGIAEVADGDVWFRGQYPTGFVQRASVSLLAVGRWQHVAASWDGQSNTAGIALYVDGAPAPTGGTLDPGGARADDSTIPLSLNNFGAAGLVGTIDDVRLYDRVLTPAEVATIYNATK